MNSRQLLSILGLIWLTATGYSQNNVSINDLGMPPHPGAILDLSALDRGFLMPRMPWWDRESMPITTKGLLVCDTTTNSLWMFTDVWWEELAMQRDVHFTHELGAIHNIGNLSADDFVFGSTHLNENGNAAHRKRFFFDKGKAAFRAGELYDVTGTTAEDESKRWDTDSLGIGSVAMGVIPLAKGAYSVAMGANARATGNSAVAIGNTGLASGSSAIAMGVTIASGDRSFSAGSTNNASGYASTALGELTVASGKFSSTFGERTAASAYASLAIGHFNVGNGDPLNWVATDPIFEIGNAPDLSQRQNALTVLKDGSLISGSHQINEDLSVSSDNKRMFFHKDKAAFRAGDLVDFSGPGTESKRWDIDSLGYGSLAIGRNTLAKGVYSIALGGNAIATGLSSVAIGNTVNAYGASAVALGTTTASGHRSFSAGSTNNAIGYASTALGELTTAGGDFSTALGRSSNAQSYGTLAAGIGSAATDTCATALGASYANGKYATSMGHSSHANGDYSLAAGDSDATGEWATASGLSNASGQWSTALGNGTATAIQSTAMGTSTASSTAATALGISTASGSYSTALGNAIAESFGGVAVGFQNIGGGSPLAWVNTDPLFEVGNGTWAVRSNAFTVLKNGRVGINHGSPQAMLDIEQPNAGPGNGVLLNLAGIGHWETMVGNNGEYNFYFNNNLRAYMTTNGIFHLPEGLDVGLATDGNLVIGQSSGWNISIDNNEIMARDNGGVHDLLLQKDGGNVSIGNNSAPTHNLTVRSGDAETMRLIGPLALGHGARLNFGDGDYVYIDEPTDDNLELRANAITLNAFSTDVTGTLSKGGGTFKIDHPLDPANKFLYHSFVESPDMMNIYNGVILLDHTGSATVTLPEWFEALNRDYRYQLTAIGAPGPNLYIAEEIQNNSFAIAGGAPGMKVSWEVTGVRQDAFANKHRMPVEQEKPPHLKGKYLYPEAHGLAKDQGIYDNEQSGNRKTGKSKMR